MSAAVMSDYYFPHVVHGHMANSQMRMQTWVPLHMAHYPPPPGPDQQHYNALYPTSAGAQQLLEPQDQLQYGNLNQPIYPKAETATPDQAPSQQHIHHLAQELQHHAALEEQQRQQIHHPSQPIPQQVPHVQPTTTSPSSQTPTQQGTPDQNQKNNRLRKACDSCSIRKVKVRSLIYSKLLHLAEIYSVTRVAHHVRHVQHSTYHAHSIGQVEEEDLQIGMLKPSNEDDWKGLQTRLISQDIHHRPLPRMLHKLWQPSHLIHPTSNSLRNLYVLLRHWTY